MNPIICYEKKHSFILTFLLQCSGVTAAKLTITKYVHSQDRQEDPRCAGNTWTCECHYKDEPTLTTWLSRLILRGSIEISRVMENIFLQRTGKLYITSTHYYTRKMYLSKQIGLLPENKTRLTYVSLAKQGLKALTISFLPQIVTIDN